MRITGDDGIANGYELTLEQRGNLVSLGLDDPHLNQGSLPDMLLAPGQARAAAHELNRLADLADGLPA